MKILITGGCGFLGCNLSVKAIEQGHEIILFDNLSRNGSRQNLEWLKQFGCFRFEHGDIRNRNDITRVVAEFLPDAVFHVAGQVAMSSSIADPLLDFETNTLGSLFLLEAIRTYVPYASVVYSSTNKVYGNLERYTYNETATRFICMEHPEGFNESIPLEFHSPYGCSKGSTDQYMLDYARIYGINTVVFRHSSIYGGRQFPTYDQGWIGWFCMKAIIQRNNFDITPFTISGSGKQVRDVLHAEDMVSLYYKALEHIDKAKGRAYNIGGGIINSLSLLELFSLLGEFTGIELKYNILQPRTSDQKVFVADISSAKQAFSWEPLVEKYKGITKMLDWIEHVI